MREQAPQHMFEKQAVDQRSHYSKRANIFDRVDEFGPMFVGFDPMGMAPRTKRPAPLNVHEA